MMGYCSCENVEWISTNDPNPYAPCIDCGEHITWKEEE